MTKKAKKYVGKYISSIDRLKSDMFEIKGVKKNFGKRYTSKKVLAGLGLTSLVIFSVIADKNDGNSIYTAKVDENTILYNEFGDIETINIGDDENDNPIIVVENPKKKNKLYKAILSTDDGELKEVYIYGKDIPKRSISKIKDFYDDTTDISIVSAPSGAFVRQNKIIDRAAGDAELLASETYVLRGLPETSFANAYTWRKILYFDEEENTKTGYMVEDYLLNVEEVEKNREFKVVSKGLNVRDKASVQDGEIISRLQEDESVFLVDNIGARSDDRYNWLYVAYKNSDTNEIELGWVAVKDKENEINYLEEVEQEEIDDDKKLITGIVDTSSVKYKNLKLREAPTKKW